MFSEERNHFLTPVQAACFHKTLCYKYTAVAKPASHKQYEITSALSCHFLCTFRLLAVKRSGDCRRVGKPRT